MRRSGSACTSRSPRCAWRPTGARHPASTSEEQPVDDVLAALVATSAKLAPLLGVLAASLAGRSPTCGSQTQKRASCSR
jgi:uncharacterized protein YbbK (DUF523 family)